MKATSSILSILCLCMIALFTGHALAATYYVDATAGVDTNNGLAEDTAWKTIAKVNAATFAPGDTIRFKRGCTWRETLVPPSSGLSDNVITFGAYGSGSNPLILGSTNTTTWIRDEGSLWVSADYSPESALAGKGIGFILFGPEAQENVGRDVRSQREMHDGVVHTKYNVDQEKEFFYDPAAKKFYVYCPEASGPVAKYGTIEIAKRAHPIYIKNKQYLAVEDINVKYSSSGVVVENSAYIRIERVAMSYLGGQIYDYATGGVLGNCIEVNRSSHHVTIQDCYAAQAYDAGLDVEIWDGAATEELRDITIAGNTVEKCGAGVSINTQPVSNLASSVHAISITGNTVKDSGSGWSGTDNSLHGVGIHVAAVQNNLLYDIAIKGNTVEDFTLAGIALMNCDNVTVKANAIKDGQGGYHEYDVVVQWDVPAAILVHGGGTDATTEVTADISYNLVYDNPGATGIHIVNNAPPTGEVAITHNVFYNNGAFSASGYNIPNVKLSSAHDHTRLADNILFATGSAPLEIPYPFPSHVSSDNNIFCGASAGIAQYNGSLYTLSQYTSYTGQDAHSRTQDPLFVDVASRDFRLQTASPAIDTGTAAGQAQDFVGKEVPYGTAVDIGAYEYIPSPAYGIVPLPAKGFFVKDFGPGGVWILQNAAWRGIYNEKGQNITASSRILTTAMLDTSGKSTIVANFGAGYGLWVGKNNAVWTLLRPESPRLVTTADIDGSGIDDLIVDFGSPYGIWVYMNNTGWLMRLHEVSAESITKADIDGNGKDDLLVDFGPGYGIWLRRDTGSWTLLHIASAKIVASGDIDGNGKDDLIIDFGTGCGIWVWHDTGSWTQLHSASAKAIASGDIDASGKVDIICDFGAGYGIWIYYNNTAWIRLIDASADSITVGDIAGEANDDIICDFGPNNGIWIRKDNSTWEKAL